MKLRKLSFLIISLLVAGMVAFTSCEGDEGPAGPQGPQGVAGDVGPQGPAGQDGQDFTVAETIFSNKSNLEPLVAMHPQFSYVTPYALISSSDVVNAGTASDFRIGGGADGAGFLVKPDGGYYYVSNFEDNFAVARLELDENFNITDAAYLLNSSVAEYARQCSGTMWEQEIHGGDRDLFLSASEAFHYDVKGIDPWVTTPTPTADFTMDGLGDFVWENAVPLPRDAYSGTVILGGDDDSGGDTGFGQISLYYSETKGDFDNGKVYVLRLRDATEISTEGDIAFGETYDVEFVEIENGASLTQDEMGQASIDAFAFQFMRVEDVDYGKGSADANRTVYFAVTGRGPGRGTFNDWGTGYKLELDPDSPLTGKMTQILSGNTDTNNMDGNLALLQSPDNICVTENFIYWQEDPNSDARGHTAYIYQSNLDGGNVQVVMEAIVRQDLAPGAPLRSIEYGALIDISDKIGEPNTFLLGIQAHYWRRDEFLSVDGGTQSAMHPWFGEYKEGSQLVVLQGLPR